MADIVRIDGAQGEGGGQILRTGASLAAITGRAVEIRNIRSGRSRPGLQPQHLAAVRAAAEICGATLRGDAPGSGFLLMSPSGPARGGRYRFEIGTAGATTLVAQTVLLPLALAASASHVSVTGGTHVPHAPMAEYLEAVYLPALRRAGVEARFSYSRAGFYPRGGGEIELEIRPGAPQPIVLCDRGELRALKGFAVTGSLPDHVADRGAAVLESLLRGMGRHPRVERRVKQSAGPGAAVLIAAEYEEGLGGFASLGERGKPMERVTEEAGERFISWWPGQAACDEHLADQLVLPAALARGESRWTTPQVTSHLTTVLEVVQQFLPIEYRIEELADGSAMVVLSGSGAP